MFRTEQHRFLNGEFMDYNFGLIWIWNTKEIFSLSSMHVLQGGRDTAPTFNLGYIHLNPLNRAEILRRIQDSWTESDPCKSEESDPWQAPTLAGGVLGNYSSPLVGCFHCCHTTSIAAITHSTIATLTVGCHYCYCGMLLLPL